MFSGAPGSEVPRQIEAQTAELLSRCGNIYSRASGCPWTLRVWYKIYRPNGCLSGLRLEGPKA